MLFAAWILAWLSILEDRAFATGDYAIARFIGDAFTVLFPPLKVSAHLCRLDKEDAVGLSREMSRNRLAHEIHHDFEGFAAREHDISDHRVLYVLDLECEYAVRVLRAANASGMLSAPIRWLLLRDHRSLSANPTTAMDESLDEIVETFRDMSAFPDSEVLLASRLDDDFMEIRSVYRPSPVRDVLLEDLGNWTAALGVQTSGLEIASRRRRNLWQTPLKSCLVLMDPDSINHLTDYQQKDKDAVAKVNYAWVKHVVSRMNATVTFRTTDNWGYRSENGSWSGLTGMLQRREIDIGGTATFLIKQRIGVIQYIQLYTNTAAGFIFRRPLLSSVSNIFTLPFHRSVWIAIAVLLLLILGLLYLSAKWEYHQYANTNSAQYWKQFNQAEQTLGDNFLVVLGTVAQQGYMYEPYTGPSRIVSLMLLIAVLSLYASYTANIVALLQSTTDSIKTLGDLADSPLKLGVHDTPYNKYYFRAAQDPIRRAIYEKVEPKRTNQKPSWMSPPEGVRRVKNELFAFHAEGGILYNLMQETYREEEKCGIKQIDFLNLWYPLMIIQTRSPYLEIVKNTALLLRETGVKYREEYRWYTKRPECNVQSSFVSVGLTECYFPMVSMGCGSLLSLILLAFELLWDKCWRVRSGGGAVVRSADATIPCDRDEDEEIEQSFDGIR